MTIATKWPYTLPAYLGASPNCLSHIDALALALGSNRLTPAEAGTAMLLTNLRTAALNGWACHLGTDDVRNLVALLYGTETVAGTEKKKGA